MTYEEYIQEATADGYNLRYQWVKLRMRPASRSFFLMGIFLLTLAGCEAMQSTLKEGYQIFTVCVSLMIFLVGSAVLILTDQPRKRGYVEFFAGEIRFVGNDGEVAHAFFLDEIAGIKERDQTDHDDDRAETRDSVTKQLCIVLNDGQIFWFECLSEAFFTARHKRLNVTLSKLKGELRRIRGSGRGLRESGL